MNLDFVMTKKNTRSAVRRDPESRKAEIVQVAKVVLAEMQYENFIPSAVADRYGVSEGTIYRYYPTKQDLLIAVAEEWMGEIMLKGPELSEGGHIYSRLRHAIHHSLEVVCKEPSIIRFIFMSVRVDSNYRNTRLYQLVAEFTSHTTRVVEEGIKAGLFRDSYHTSLIRDVIFGAIEHQAWPYLRGETDAPLDKVADDIADIVYCGLAKSPPVKIELVERSVKKVESALEGINKELQAIEKIVGITSTKTKSNKK
ncbi:MAG: TetR/AcrR family transcriptional regulator [Anaerolineaceae bacterium]|nr:TetR/AcrR family transcriptional regulator [Anaerolineaceae bacterium]